MKFPNGIETGAVAIVSDGNEKFLLGLSCEGRGWSLPGGQKDRPREHLERGGRFDVNSDRAGCLST